VFLREERDLRESLAGNVEVKNPLFFCKEHVGNTIME
jgi:hypothetical protein